MCFFFQCQVVFALSSHESQLVMVFVRGSPKFRPLIHGITLGIRDLRSAGLVMMILQVVYIDPKVSRLLPAIPDD